MAIIQWNAGETKSAIYAPGDTVEIHGISPAHLLIQPTTTGVTMNAYRQGQLFLQSADNNPLAPAQLNLAWDDGGKLVSAGSDAISAGEGSDFILGNADSNTLAGGKGDDFLYGDEGNDVLSGDGGNDSLNGGPGNDTLDGGAGHGNFMLGDTGDDRFIVRDRTDFVFDSQGNDSGMIYADWFKASAQVETWEWAPGVQKLPYWIDALVSDLGTYAPLMLGPGGTVRYNFAQYAEAYSVATDRKGFEPFTADQQTYTRKVLDYISTLTNVHFEYSAEPNGPFTILFGNNQQTNSHGYTRPPLVEVAGEPLMVSGLTRARFPSSDGGAHLQSVLTHEMGHALGLKHPFSMVDSVGTVSPGPYLGVEEDRMSVTVMSYTELAPMSDLAYSPLDIAALQYLWGVSPQAHAGDSRYVLNADTAQMIWDGSGADTIDGAALQADLTLYLEPGYWSHAGNKGSLITAPGQYTINFGTQIEHALGGAGNDKIIGNALDNQLGGGAGNDTLSGDAGNDNLAAGDGNDVLDGGAGNDLLAGGAGNDQLTGGDGSDRFDGGAGTDTAVFSGAYSAYTISGSQDGWAVTGADGSDTLTGIERLRFSDAVLALDTGKDGVAGQVYRLYQAAFDRKPDAGGLTYWMGQADQGASVTSIADSFLRSEEFSKLYGGANPTPETYLTQLYSNVLHRPYDQAGYDYWLGVMKQGAARTDVLLSFAASDENVEALAKVIGRGFEYTYAG
ncbi:MAG: DUF4214 domain-containing protein [Burkholderiaceae bacterium]|nr:DUF4214 domain-containing protein [Burkholderiaceae bacterium]